MDAAVRAWLISQLGTTTSLVDLEQRYTRLRTARAVALEVLAERLAALLARPATINLSSVVSVSYAENIRALERKIATLQAGKPLAPDEADPDGDGTAGDNSIGVVQLVERPRR